MSEDVVEGTVVPLPPDSNPANVVSGPSGLASRLPDTAFLYEQGDGAETELSDAYRSIIDQILSAETPDQILTPVEVKQPRDVVGEPLDFFDVRWQRSEYDAGSPMYASFECKEVATGTPVVVNCGQKAVMAQAVRLQQLDGFPFRGHFRQTGTNDKGTAMFRLTKSPEFQGEPLPF